MGEKTQTYLDNTGQNHYNYFAKMVFVCAPRNFAGAKERNDLNMANMKKEYKMSAERKEELQKELFAVSEKVYKAANPQGAENAQPQGGAQNSDPNVYEADFTDVDDNNKQ